MIQNLAEAIKNKDWEGVITFYESFTGQECERSKPVKKKKVVEPLDIKKEAALMMAELRELDNKPAARTGGFLRGDFDFSVVHGKPKASKAQSNKSESSKKTPAKPQKKASKSSKTNAVRQNKFEEIAPTIVIDEPGADKVRDSVPLTPRNRKPFKLKKATCELCTQTFEIAPVLYRENWKCDKCCLRAKPGGSE